jgi:fibro-slime domain-containing protein
MLRNGHNFHFTSELRYWFEYHGGEQLSFRGDDDVWVFINGHRAIDLGGVHAAESDSITLDMAAASRLGLRTGGIYEVALFQAERQTTSSTYKLTLSGFNAAPSECRPVCGDGILGIGEECDDGAANNTGGYGRCNPDCTLGAYCGDGIVQNPPEECDAGPGGNATCSSTCKSLVW